MDLRGHVNNDKTQFLPLESFYFLVKNYNVYLRKGVKVRSPNSTEYVMANIKQYAAICKFKGIRLRKLKMAKINVYNNKLLITDTQRLFHEHVQIDIKCLL